MRISSPPCLWCMYDILTFMKRLLVLPGCDCRNGPAQDRGDATQGAPSTFAYPGKALLKPPVSKMFLITSSVQSNSSIVLYIHSDLNDFFYSLFSRPFHFTSYN
ncbi:hypothetical protein B0I72DRAFT_162798, partial [Yarrowia lipolytica]|uniref:YALI0C20229p n=2 Tax=Yarrowia lipolytica TaxID=4952 RepID=Q6CBC0_YARLI|eukprot:XP_502042.2 YALI0C20229p [Yarrowia lipolytica CLIB122]